jgi:hypothetical protein
MPTVAAAKMGGCSQASGRPTHHGCVGQSSGWLRLARPRCESAARDAFTHLNKLRHECGIDTMWGPSLLLTPEHLLSLLQSFSFSVLVSLAHPSSGPPLDYGGASACDEIRDDGRSFAFPANLSLPRRRLNAGQRLSDKTPVASLTSAARPRPACTAPGGRQSHEKF